MDVRTEEQIPNLPSPKTWTPSPPYSNEPINLQSKRSSMMQLDSLIRCFRCSRLCNSSQGLEQCQSLAPNGGNGSCHQFCCCSTDPSILRNSLLSNTINSRNYSKNCFCPNIGMCTRMPSPSIHKEEIASGVSCLRRERTLADSQSYHACFPRTNCSSDCYNLSSTLNSMVRTLDRNNPFDEML